MREEAQRTAQESRQRAADAVNKTKVTPEFEIGQKVYKVKDVLGDTEDHKTAPKFEGPYVIIDRAPHNVYKLQHFHTGKILKSYLHVDKLKPCGAARAARHDRRQITVINGNTDGRAHACQGQQRKRGRGGATRPWTAIYRNAVRKYGQSHITVEIRTKKHLRRDAGRDGKPGGGGTVVPTNGGSTGAGANTTAGARGGAGARAPGRGGGTCAARYGGGGPYTGGATATGATTLPTSGTINRRCPMSCTRRRRRTAENKYK